MEEECALEPLITPRRRPINESGHDRVGFLHCPHCISPCLTCHPQVRLVCLSALNSATENRLSIDCFWHAAILIPSEEDFCQHIRFRVALTRSLPLAPSRTVAVYDDGTVIILSLLSRRSLRFLFTNQQQIPSIRLPRSHILTGLSVTKPSITLHEVKA